MNPQSNKFTVKAFEALRNSIIEKINLTFKSALSLDFERMTSGVSFKQIMCFRCGCLKLNKAANKKRDLDDVLNEINKRLRDDLAARAEGA